MEYGSAVSLMRRMPEMKMPALDRARRVIQFRLTRMPASATIRDLRNKFPKIRRLVEAEGEVLLSESGKTKYRLMLHTVQPAKSSSRVD